ncbi:MAG: hypothetical protein QGH83_03160 [Candidatus Pacebacteria bacterium]|nr:hypothetical protein [Candidatus Paceibacterota bacterium]
MSKSPMVKDIVEEVVAVIGFQAKYLPRKYGTALDPVFGEDPSSKFDTVWTLNILIDDYQEYGDVGDFYSKFGVTVTDEMKVSFTKTQFAEQTIDTDDDTPIAGDLLYFPDAEALFEVTFVGNDSSFYPTPEGPQHVWTLTLKPWEYGGEDIDTGDAQIDALETEIQDAVDKELDTPDWDDMGDDILDLSEMNPFGST